MSLIVALESLAVLSTHPIHPGDVLDLPHPLARSMVKAGLASKLHPYSLRVYPVRLPAASINPPIVVKTHRKGIDHARVVPETNGSRLTTPPCG